MALSWDAQREINIQNNMEMLLRLDISSGHMLPPSIRAKHPPKQKAISKRKAPTLDYGSETVCDEPPSKSKRVEVVEFTGLRRSSRTASKVVDYTGDGDKLEHRRSPKIVTESARQGGMKMEAKIADRRTQNPKQYGSIPGIKVGTWWESRLDCSADAVHAPVVAGITAGPNGAYSVALSGGYEDDVDLGEGFTYTGSGGRDLKGTKNSPKNLRTAPQSCDQTWNNPFNSALQRSVESKKPVRVIRGYKLRSEFAPEEGYRYDGLYTVEKAWQEPGLNPKRYLVCKFVFRRIPGQPPLPRRGEETAEEEGSVAEEDED